jgi:hypothetical protein
LWKEAVHSSQGKEQGGGAPTKRRGGKKERKEYMKRKEVQEAQTSCQNIEAEELSFRATLWEDQQG